MMMPCLSDTVICFDLDDTLYKEIDFVASSYGEIAETIGHPDAVQTMLAWFYAGENVFEKLIASYGLKLTVSDLLKIYRNHYPHISLEPRVRVFLDNLKVAGAKLGLITDGRSLSQRNKLESLGLDGFFDIVIISEEFGSEKPDTRNFLAVMDSFLQRKRFIYVADNPKKDFIAPNRLGWSTYCLKSDGRNIHKQDFLLDCEYLPQYWVNTLYEVIK